MILVHKNCGGVVKESKNLPPYESEEYGIVPAYECQECGQEILGDIQIQLISENELDEIQIESLIIKN